MDINDTFPSEYLKTSDLKGRTVAVVMNHAVMEKVGDDHKPVLYFEGKEKGLVLNKTNATTIAGMYGPETDNWHGRPIAIFPTQTDFQGRQVECIRVQIKPPAMPQTAPPVQAPPPQTEPVYSEPVQQQRLEGVEDGEIPF